MKCPYQPRTCHDCYFAEWQIKDNELHKGECSYPDEAIHRVLVKNTPACVPASFYTHISKADLKPEKPFSNCPFWRKRNG